MRENGARAGEHREAGRPGLVAGLGSGGRTVRERAGGVTCTLSAQSRPDELGRPSPGIVQIPPSPGKPSQILHSEASAPCCAVLSGLFLAFTWCLSPSPDPRTLRQTPCLKDFCLYHLLPSIAGRESVVSRACTKYLLWILSLSLYKKCRR